MARLSLTDKSVVVTDKDIGRGQPRITLRNVECVGTEANITQCPRENSQRICFSLGAGVICPFGNISVA